jgi:hypothetical protein
MTLRAKLQETLSGDGAGLPSRMIYTESERSGVHTQKVRLHKRSQKGKDWDGTAANDNIAWPLATALIKEGNTELLKYAMLYRKVYDTAKSEAKLGGSNAVLRDGMSLDRHIHVREDGRIVQKHVRQSTAANVDIPARKKVPPFADEETDVQRDTVRVPKAWNGDRPVNDMMDAQQHLSRLQSALGYLCEPFELACIDGRTLEAVGNSVGTANRAGAMGAGRALVHMALVTLRDCIGDVKRGDLVTAKV